MRLQIPALPIPHPRSRSPSFTSTFLQSPKLAFCYPCPLCKFSSREHSKPPRLLFQKICVLNGKPHVIAENHDTITKFRCLTSKRPSGQPINLLIFLSNNFSVIFFSTNHNLPQSLYKYYSTITPSSQQGENQGHRVWTPSGSGSLGCFLRFFFLTNSYPSLISPCTL